MPRRRKQKGGGWDKAWKAAAIANNKIIEAKSEAAAKAAAAAAAASDIPSISMEESAAKAATAKRLLDQPYANTMPKYGCLPLAMAGLPESPASLPPTPCPPTGIPSWVEALAAAAPDPLAMIPGPPFAAGIASAVSSRGKVDSQLNKIQSNMRLEAKAKKMGILVPPEIESADYEVKQNTKEAARLLCPDQILFGGWDCDKSRFQQLKISGPDTLTGGVFGKQGAAGGPGEASGGDGGEGAGADQMPDAATLEKQDMGLEDSYAKKALGNQRPAPKLIPQGDAPPPPSTVEWDPGYIGKDVQIFHGGRRKRRTRKKHKRRRRKRHTKRGGWFGKNWFGTWAQKPKEGPIKGSKTSKGQSCNPYLPGQCFGGLKCVPSGLGIGGFSFGGRCVMQGGKPKKTRSKRARRRRKKQKNTIKKIHQTDIEGGVMCGDGKQFETCQKCGLLLGNTKSEKAKACNSNDCRWDPFNHQCDPICQAPTMDGKPCTKTAATFGQLNLLVEKIWEKMPRWIQAKLGEKLKYQVISSIGPMCKKHALQQILFNLYIIIDPWSTSNVRKRDQDFRAQVQDWKYGEPYAHMRTGSDRWISNGGCKTRRRKSRRKRR